MGSGFVADEANRLVVTNNHVVGGEPQVAVVFPIYDRAGELVTDSGPYVKAAREVAAKGEVLARDPARDLALVRVERLRDRSVAVRLATQPAPTGASVYSVGGSGAVGDNLLWRLTKGTVRGRAHRKGEIKGESFDCMILETDAPLNHGDSGGPIMNDRGELVGVVSHGSTVERQVSGNIDVEEVRKFIRQHRPGR
jgi:S1-C subfamily serine protease